MAEILIFDFLSHAFAGWGSKSQEATSVYADDEFGI